jgi:glycosyltransferase involved in cell wall biosynthesis
MIKVLYFVDRLRRGGIQSLLYDMLQYLDKERIQMDVLTLDDGIHYDLEDAIQQLGVTIYKLQDVWIRKPWDYWAYARSMKRFFLQHSGYHAVHMNSSSKNFGVLYYAKQVGIPVRIAHAHSPRIQSNNLLFKLVGECWKPLLRKYATHLIACSKNVGKGMFGTRALNKGEIIFLPNGIVIDKFAFNEELRATLRRELNVSPDCLVIGNVARLVPLKNHAFLLRVASELKKRNKNFKMLFIGSGECENELRTLTNQLNLNSEIAYLGFREERNEWYSVMDIYVMPSLYEGFPITLIEAQTAGLPIVASDTLTRETKLSSVEDFTYLPIHGEDSVKQWADVVCHEYRTNRHQGRKLVEKTDYNIQSMLGKLYALYEH